MTEVQVTPVRKAGRVRVRCIDGKFVQCPEAWRNRLPLGVPFRITAALRADGSCYVYTPDGWAYETRHAEAARTSIVSF
jgi:hypothetical protein